MIAYFAADLIWATRIKFAAEALGIEARPVRNLEMLGARLGEGKVRGLVVDLDGPETALALIRRAREHDAAAATGGAIRIAAFGPHVDTAVLAHAREAGADLVLARGAFHHGMAQVLRSLDEPKPGE